MGLRMMCRYCYHSSLAAFSAFVHCRDSWVSRWWYAKVDSALDSINRIPIADPAESADNEFASGHLIKRPIFQCGANLWTDENHNCEAPLSIVDTSRPVRLCSGCWRLGWRWHSRGFHIFNLTSNTHYRADISHAEAVLSSGSFLA